MWDIAGMSLDMVLPAYSTVARIGRAWFKVRSYSPVPLFLLMFFLSPSFHPHFVEMALAVLGILLAEGLRILSVGYAGSATRTRGDSVPKLVHSGPYRFVRNPLYVANIVMYTCAGIVFGFSGLTVLIFLVSSLEYIFIVAFEEETLFHLFGAAYENYCGKVPRWIPAWTPQIESTEQEFSLQRALRSERSTFLSLAMMVILFIIKNSF